MKRLIFTVILLAINVPVVTGQNDSVHIFKDYVWVKPGPEYEAGWLHEFFFGSHWRDVWTTSIRVGILDLSTFAGGLTPTKRGGRLQTKSLTFKGNDGKKYKFRSVNKDPKKVLPPELRESTAGDIFQDQVSSAYPLAPLVVAPLLSEVKVIGSPPILTMLPDDEKLGEFRKDFGGLLGHIEVVQEEETDGADKIIGSNKLFDRLDEERDEAVDSREFLKARLIDILVGDWDRHRGQWDWARFKTDSLKIYEPIPADRDQAFSKFDGVFPSIFATMVPQINSFKEDYPSMKSMTWSGRYLDRMFLVFLDKHSWDSVTNYVYSRLTDKVIEDAVKQVPAPAYEISKDELLTKLKSRRNELREASNEFYEHVNKYTDVFGTDKNEYVEIKGLPDGKTEIAVYKRDKKTGEKEGNALKHKIFDNNITLELRIFLKDGDDKVLISGKEDNTPRIRVIGGDGEDELIDNSDLPVKFYDDGKKTKIKEGENTSVDDNKYAEPWDSLEAVYNKVKDKISEDDKEKAEEFINGIKYLPERRDRGHEWAFSPYFAYNPDVGATVGVGIILYKYGFRMHPNVYKMQLTAGYTPQKKNISGLLLDYKSNFYGIIRGAQTNLHMRKSGIELNHYFGPGNETTYNDSLYKARYNTINHNEYIFNPSFEFPLNKIYRFNAGVLAKYIQVKPDENPFIRDSMPYGTGKISYLAGQFGIKFDGRDHPAAPLSGYFISLQGSYFPKVFNNQNPFTKAEGDMRAYLHAAPFTLALRVRGEKIWGTYPFYETAFIGGSRSIRGFASERFAGDASLVGGVELRTKLFDMSLLLPETVYMFLFGESGRVFLKGEDSKLWHIGYGGGLAISIINRDMTFSLSYARSKERKVSFYFNTGFSF